MVGSGSHRRVMSTLTLVAVASAQLETLGTSLAGDFPLPHTTEPLTHIIFSDD